MSVSFDAQLAAPANVLMRQVGGESVLLNLDTETYYGLDSVGTRMWEVLTSSDTIQQAYDMLLTEYDIDPETLRQDVDKLIEHLLENQLVEMR